MNNSKKNISLDPIIKKVIALKENRELSAEEQRLADCAEQKIVDFVRINKRFRNQVSPTDLVKYVLRVQRYVLDLPGITKTKMHGLQAIIKCGCTTPNTYSGRGFRHYQKVTYYRGSIVTVEMRHGRWYLIDADYDDLMDDKYTILFTQDQKDMILNGLKHMD